MNPQIQTEIQTRSTVIRPGPRRIPGLFDVPAAGCRRRPDQLSNFVESLIAPQRSIGAH